MRHSSGRRSIQNQSDSDSKATTWPTMMNRAERRKSESTKHVEVMSSGSEGSTDETAGQNAGMMELQRQMTAQRDEMKRKIEGELKRVEEAIAAEKRKGQGQAQPEDAEPDNDWKSDRVKKEKSKDKEKPKDKKKKSKKESSKKHVDKKEKVAKADRHVVEIQKQSDSDSEADHSPAKMNRAERRKSESTKHVEVMSSGSESSADETAGQTAGMMELQRQMTAQRDEMKRKIEGELKRVEEAIAAEKRKGQGQGQQRVKQDEGKQVVANEEDEAIEKERKKERDRLKRKLWNEKSRLRWAASKKRQSEDGEEGRGKVDISAVNGSVEKVKSVKRDREKEGGSDEAQAKIARRAAREEKRGGR
jgi:hypothetical protein